MRDIGGALLVGDCQRRLPCKPEDRQKGRSFGIVKPAIPCLMGNCGLSQHASILGGLVSCFVGPVVDCGRQHACVLKPLPVNRAVITHYALRTLASIRLYLTRLERQTKESNMCASLWVIKTRGYNESKGSFGC